MCFNIHYINSECCCKKESKVNNQQGNNPCCKSCKGNKFQDVNSGSKEIKRDGGIKNNNKENNINHDEIRQILKEVGIKYANFDDFVNKQKQMEERIKKKKKKEEQRQQKLERERLERERQKQEEAERLEQKRLEEEEKQKLDEEKKLEEQKRKEEEEKKRLEQKRLEEEEKKKLEQKRLEEEELKRIEEQKKKEEDEIRKQKLEKEKLEREQKKKEEEERLKKEEEERKKKEEEERLKKEEEERKKKEEEERKKKEEDNTKKEQEERLRQLEEGGKNYQKVEEYKKKVEEIVEKIKDDDLLCNFIKNIKDININCNASSHFLKTIKNVEYKKNIEQFLNENKKYIYSKLDEINENINNSKNDDEVRRKDFLKRLPNGSKYGKTSETEIKKSKYVAELYNVPFFSTYEGVGDVMIPFAFELTKDYKGIFPEKMIKIVDTKLDNDIDKDKDFHIYFCYQYFVNTSIENMEAINCLLFRPHYFIAKEEIDNCKNDNGFIYNPNEKNPKKENICVVFGHNKCLFDGIIDDFGIHNDRLSAHDPIVGLISKKTVNNIPVFYSFVLEKDKKIAAMTIHFFKFIEDGFTSNIGDEIADNPISTIENAINFAKKQGDNDVVEFLNGIIK